LNPNQLIARAKGVTRNSTGNPEDINLQQYVLWAVKERPDAMVIVAGTRDTTPAMSRWKILRGERNASKGWCVVEADNLPDTTIIVRKEFLRTR
jgi:hypothetical protein